MTRKEEWNHLFETNESLYFYGAGEISKILVDQAKKCGFERRIKGILVSACKEQTKQNIEGIPVVLAESVKDVDTLVMVAVSAKYSDEIKEYAKKLGFKNLVDGFKFVHIVDEETALDHQGKEQIRYLKDAGGNADDLRLILKMLYGNNQLFGEGGEFYQSLPVLGIEGTRPTDVRLSIYGLSEIVYGKKVVDIGCNVAFLDIALADKAKSIYGIEYSNSLVEIANEVIDYLDISNIIVEQGDFLSWSTQEMYDVILLFAVHGWLGCSAEYGAKKIASMVEKDGTIVFESQDLSKGDDLYDQYCRQFEQMGFVAMKSGEICDDGKTNRSWVVYKR